MAVSIRKDNKVATKGKVRDAIAIVEGDGWAKVPSNSGSHRQFKHPNKKGRVTIAGKPSKDLDVDVWNSIMRQAGLR